MRAAKICPRVKAEPRASPSSLEQFRLNSHTYNGPVIRTMGISQNNWHQGKTSFINYGSLPNDLAIPCTVGLLPAYGNLAT